ncbi:hypothetical protein GGI09_006551 [Coemansia sp. S100]|nr:hypothetical protein LPJ71_000055 [Coemansia sp. S17]KAJ2087273.1 hypothetical protein GGI09_006551 [Coemansia sp. S100]KAJ2105629.1 hypothetical protein GGI16_002272 [Coemansia sp. S142-1]
MMKLAAIVAFFATTVFGAQTSSSVEPNQACVKACQVAPEDQRETCMRVCSQFAEQGINFAPATATTHSSAPAIKPTIPVASSPAKSSVGAKPTDSGLSSGASGVSSTESVKSQGEDNSEDHASASVKSMSLANDAHNMARLGASALVLAAVALF